MNTDNDIEKLPRAIIQVINKNEDKFTQEDYNRLETISFILGRCHDCMLKLEQIYALKNYSFELMNCTDEISTNLAQNEILYRSLKESFKGFIEDTDKRQYALQDLNHQKLKRNSSILWGK